jgi:hypothetical protein
MVHDMNQRKTKEPQGLDLLATLIRLLADQEGVKIDFELERVQS